MHLIVAITGASGVIYGVRTVKALKELGASIELIISRNGEAVLKEELGLKREDLLPYCSRLYSADDMLSPLSSGSYKTDGMIVVPCSSKTLACIANGISENLVSRAAEVTLKQKRKLVLVVREAPLNSIHLENMLKVSQAGAIILPACPAFYHKPKTIEEMVDFIVGKILDVLGIEHQLFKRWGA